MITITHRPARHGWEYQADVQGIDGGGRSFEESVDASDHEVRRYLSRRAGHAVSFAQALDGTTHHRVDAHLSS
jgi:hypothetical protein